MSVNKVILVGNVGKDVETRHLDGGNQVSNFSLATSETYIPKGGEKQTITEWHNIVAWNKLSEICEKYVKKGQQIYIEGSISTRSWDDKDGNKRYTTEIKATSIQLLGKKENQTDDQQGSYQSSNYQNHSNPSGLPPSEMAFSGNQSPEEDDLPF